MLRLWIALSFLYVAALSVVAYYDWGEIERPVLLYVLPNAEADISRVENIFTEFDPDIAKAVTVHEVGTIHLMIKKFVPDNVASEKAAKFKQDVADPIYERYWRRRSNFIQTYAMSALLPPLALLALGVIVGWVVRGFRGDGANASG